MIEVVVEDVKEAVVETVTEIAGAEEVVAAVAVMIVEVVAVVDLTETGYDKILLKSFICSFRRHFFYDDCWSCLSCHDFMVFIYKSLNIEN